VDPDGRFPFNIHSEIVNEAILGKSYYFTPIRKTLVTCAGYIADFKHASNNMVHLDNMKGYTSIATAYNNAVKSFKSNINKGGWEVAGISLHTVADFYSHSNYIELYREYARENHLSMAIEDIPTFSEAQNDSKLVDFLKDKDFRTGTYGDGPLAYIRDKISKDPMSHNKTNKDNKNTSAGRIQYNDTATMYDAALAVAKKDTKNIVNEK